jgi:hypothetical protein
LAIPYGKWSLIRLVFTSLLYFGFAPLSRKAGLNTLLLLLKNAFQLPFREDPALAGEGQIQIVLEKIPAIL